MKLKNKNKMKNVIVILTSSLLFCTAVNAQKYFTKTGKINFNATAPASPEKIEGINNTATCVIDTKTGGIQFAILMKGFEFSRALMQEHFNENYLETNKYPKAEFKGIITDNASVNYLSDGTYKVKVKGNLTMHGETKAVETTGTIAIKGGKITTAASFNALLTDYKISIPGLVADKVAKAASINVNCILELFK